MRYMKRLNEEKIWLNQMLGLSKSPVESPAVAPHFFYKMNGLKSEFLIEKMIFWFKKKMGLNGVWKCDDLGPNYSLKRVFE